MKSLIKIFALLIFVVVLFSLTSESTAQTDKNNQTKKVAYYKVIPNGYKTIKFNKNKIYSCDGKYFKKAEKGYKVIHPPIGLRINKLPQKAKKIIVTYQAYYLKYNIYYKYNLRTNTYIVVKNPL